MSGNEIRSNIEEFLEEDESIQNHLGYGNWVWIATTDRLIKYRKSDDGRHETTDVSYDRMFGIERVDAGRQPKYLFAGIAMVAFGWLWALDAGPARPELGHTLVMYGPLLLSLIPFALYANSDTTYYQVGIVDAASEESSDWRIDIDGVDDEELNAFVQSVRTQLNT